MYLKYRRLLFNRLRRHKSIEIYPNTFWIYAKNVIHCYSLQTHRRKRRCYPKAIGCRSKMNTENETVKLSKRKQEVLTLIEINQDITHSKTAQALSITVVTAKRTTRALQGLGVLKRTVSKIRQDREE